MKDTQVLWKASSFAGGSRNEDLDRSVILRREPQGNQEPPALVPTRTGDNGCPGVAKEGNAFRLRHAPAAHTKRRKTALCAEVTGKMVVRPSLGLSALAILRRFAGAG